MTPSNNIIVTIDLGRIRANVRAIAQATGVPVYAVVKADAYGLGAAEIAGAIADLVSGWCVFRLDEAIAAGLAQTGKPTLVLGPPETQRLAEYREHGARPAVSNAEDAAALREAGPVLCCDTGMQRFACPPEHIDDVLRAGQIGEAFTHGVTMEHVEKLLAMTAGRGLALHAAGSALLEEPRAYLNAVRPGLAMYTDAVRVTTPLVEVRDTRGPVGYTSFSAARIGVILGGYSNGLRKGRCTVNGQPARLAEVGMQSAYIDLTGIPARVGDEVMLLGPGATPWDLAAGWSASPHVALTTLAGAGRRHYIK